VLLDAGPLGLVSHPRKNPEIKTWLQALLQTGTIVRVPEITDYEVRRELIRANKLKSVERLNVLKIMLGYLPLTTEAMLKAAELWAQARQQGNPTASDQALEGVLKGINYELRHSGSPLAPLKKGGNRTQSPPFLRGI
jgi:toxin FitB